MSTINITANVAKEIAEISGDFTNPIEVLRESLHNAYDAGGKRVLIEARPHKLRDGRRALTLDVIDDGLGMDAQGLESFFGLGHSDKPVVKGRKSIGFKGHGTKIYYQAADLIVASRRDGGELHLAVVRRARDFINDQTLPTPELLIGGAAEELASKEKIPLPHRTGTTIRMEDFTPDSNRLIDAFKTDPIENYLRWFTVFASFEHVVRNCAPVPPLELFLQGTDRTTPKQVSFGHYWPEKDAVDLKQLRNRDQRRPFNYFCKTFRFPHRAIEGGYTIDVAAAFEGKHARLDRDKGVSRQRVGGLYAEEERYGLWLCRDYVPVEKRFDWLFEEDCPKLAEDLRRPLIFVNCQDFMLIANRGSVGNSSQQLMDAVKKAIYEIIAEMLDDKDLERFLNEYQEDVYSRRREKDKKALTRRVERYNKKRYCHITLPDGRKHAFYEPTREITLFGLISELQLLDRGILGFEILDYDDHSGIDLLVRRNGTPSDLLDRNKVAYVELKYELTSQLNHAFDSLHAVVCWDLEIGPGDFVRDATNNNFQYQQAKDDSGITYSNLVPLPGNKLSNNVRVIVLKRLLEERYQLTMSPNPLPVGRDK